MSESHCTSSRRRSAAPWGFRGGRRPFAVALIALGLGIAACGGDSDSESSSPSTTASTAANTSATTLPTATTTPATTAAPAATSSTEPSSEDCPTFTENEELPLKICDKGEMVAEVQQGLVDAGHDIETDGFFGAQTQNAVFEFQVANGLEVDGVVGPLTFAELFPE